MFSTSNPLRGLEFYSGLGGFHYGATLFNKMVQAADTFLPPSDCTADWYKSQHTSTPELFCPLPNRVYDSNSSIFTSTTSNHPTTTESIPPNLPQVQIVESFDINPIANTVYSHNFQRQPNSTDIAILTTDQISAYKSNIWFVSNPCQPFTIQNELNLDEKDPRTNSFLNLLHILTELTIKPSFLVLENVENFELSCSYQILLQTLLQSGYSWTSFILSPRQFGIPNQRSRFFLIASRHLNPLLPFQKLFNNAHINIAPEFIQSTASSLQSTIISPSGITTHVVPQITQNVYKFLPTCHFLPNFCAAAFFNNNENFLQSYHTLWRNPDANLDVVRSTAKIPLFHTTAESINLNTLEIASVLPPTIDISSNSFQSTFTISNVMDIPSTAHVDTDIIQTNTIRMKDRDHQITRQRTIFENEFLPIVLPSTLQHFLVDHTDLSYSSYQQFVDIIEKNTLGTNQIDENSANNERNEHQEQEEKTTDGNPLPISMDDILANVTSVEDIELLDCISKKEKNKLKRTFIKKFKKWENLHASGKSSTQSDPHHSEFDASSLNSQVISPNSNFAKLPRNFLLQHRQEQFQSDRYRKEKLLLDTAQSAQSLQIDPKLFLKGSVYTIDIVNHSDRSTCCITKGYSTYFRGTGSILETYRPKFKSQLPKTKSLTSSTTAFSSQPHQSNQQNAFNTIPLDNSRYNSSTTEDIDTQICVNDKRNTNLFPDSEAFFTQTPLESAFLSSLSTSHPTLMSFLSPQVHSSCDMNEIFEKPIKDNTEDEHVLFLSQSAPMALRGLRYFLPREVANLNMLPPSKLTMETSVNDQTTTSHYYSHFDFPENITSKQRLKLLGNGLNSYIISQLLLVLLGGHYRHYLSNSPSNSTQ